MTKLIIASLLSFVAMIGFFLVGGLVGGSDGYIMESAVHLSLGFVSGWGLYRAWFKERKKKLFIAQCYALVGVACTLLAAVALALLD